MKSLLKWLDRHGEESIILVMLSYMVLSLNVEIIRRYVFSQSSPYTEEIARFLLIWIVFFGIPYGIRWNRHVIIDLLPDALDPRVNLACRLIANLICIVFLFVFVRLAWHTLWYMVTREIITDALAIPKWWIMAAIPLGCTLGILRFVQNSLLVIQDYRKQVRP